MPVPWVFGEVANMPIAVLIPITVLPVAAAERTYRMLRLQ